MFLQKSTSPIFPQLQKLVFYSCQFDLANYHPKLYPQFEVSMPLSIQNSVDKRQAEFLAGRYAAQKVLKKLRVESGIPIGENRSPQWPEGVIGSITHTDHHACVVAAHIKDYLMLGIDCENWITNTTVYEINDTIISKEESNLLRETRYQYSKLFTLIFSAKESLFKALYPKVGKYFDFSAASLIQLSLSDHFFILRLDINLSDTFKKGLKFKGYFHINHKLVTTVIAVPILNLP